MSHAPGRQTKAGGKPRQNKSPAHSHKSSAFNPVPPVVRGSDITYHGQYLAFYGSRGPLSNFYTGKPFRGSQAVQYLLDRLTELNLPDLYMPARDSIAVEIMSEHQFTCGEQFLMACKGFLFEFPHISTSTQLDQHLEARKQDILQLCQSNFKQVLMAQTAGEMKTLGRLTPNFNPDIWDKVSIYVAIAASLARADADKALASIYTENWDFSTNKPKHKFVEASPSDKIWGIGMGRQDSNIKHKANWKGLNRPGECHDEACRIFNEKRLPKKDINEDEVGEMMGDTQEEGKEGQQAGTSSALKRKSESA